MNKFTSNNLYPRGGLPGFDMEAMMEARADLYQLFIRSRFEADMTRVIGFEDGARWMFLHHESELFIRFLMLWQFANAAAGEGFEINGIDAASLCESVAKSGDQMEAWNKQAEALVL